MSTKKRENVIPLKHVALMGKQMIKAKQILALGKIIGMKAKYFAEQRDNVHMQDLDYVLEKMKELETFLK